MEGFQQLKCEFTVVSVHIWMNGCPTNFSELPLGLSLLLETREEYSGVRVLLYLFVVVLLLVFWYGMVWYGMVLLVTGNACCYRSCGS